MTAKQAATDRRTQILDGAVRLAAKRGYQNITRDEVADLAGVSTGLINKYFSTMTQLKRDVMRAAVRAPQNRDSLVIIAQGIALNDRQALRAPQVVRDAALATLAN